MGLSDINMGLEEAIRVARVIKKAKVKYGKYGSAPVTDQEAQSAMVLLLDELEEVQKDSEVASGDAVDAATAEMKAEIVKLKQSISGLKTANAKLKKKLEGVANTD